LYVSIENCDVRNVSITRRIYPIIASSNLPICLIFGIIVKWEIRARIKRDDKIWSNDVFHDAAARRAQSSSWLLLQFSGFYNCIAAELYIYPCIIFMQRVELWIAAAGCMTISSRYVSDSQWWICQITLG